MASKDTFAQLSPLNDGAYIFLMFSWTSKSSSPPYGGIPGDSNRYMMTPMDHKSD